MSAVRTATTSEVQQLLADGAQLVDVLPAETFVQEHLPGAISIPLAEINSAAQRLEPSRPVVVYCYDYQCDLSPRAACRLRQLGFERVYDYVASKAAWLAEGLPGDGLLLDRKGGGGVARRDVPRMAVDCSLADAGARLDGWELAAVVSDDGIVVGVVRAEAVAG